MTESLLNARKKLASVLEIYTPFGNGRANAIAAMTAAVVEFESAIREDERTQLGAQLNAAQIEANEANARAHAAPAPAAPAPLSAAQVEALAASNPPPVVVPDAPPVAADMQPKYDVTPPAPLEANPTTVITSNGPSVPPVEVAPEPEKKKRK